MASRSDRGGPGSGRGPSPSGGGAWRGDLARPVTRLGAFLVDLGLVVGAGLLVRLIGGLPADVGGAPSVPGAVLGVSVSVALAGVQLYMFGRATTLGKRALGLIAVGPDGVPVSFWPMLARETVGKLLSGILFLLGFAWILIDEQRQGWHDKLIDSYVVRERSLRR